VSSDTLVIQTAFLGDVVLSTGLFTALARRHGPVDVLVRPAAVPLVETHPAVSEAFGFDKRGRDRGLGGLRRTAGRIRLRGYRRVYLPHRSLRSAALAWLAGVPERIGFRDGPGVWLYTRRIARPPRGHEAERLLALAEPAPGSVAEIGLGITDDDRAQAYAWLADRGVGDGFVALAPGSVWATKRWPAYPDLVKLIRGPIVVIGGPEDGPLAAPLVDAAPDRVASAVGQTSLRVSAALIERAAVLVTNDSAPLHLASAVGTPVVAIFGPTAPRQGFGPRGPAAAVVERTDLRCRPCSAHGPARCPLGHHRCMREIPATAVHEAIAALIR